MKKTPSNDSHNLHPFFSVLPTSPKPAQNQPKPHFLFHKNVSLRDFCRMTLVKRLTKCHPPPWKRQEINV